MYHHNKKNKKIGIKIIFFMLFLGIVVIGLIYKVKPELIEPYLKSQSGKVAEFNLERIKDVTEEKIEKFKDSIESNIDDLKNTFNPNKNVQKDNLKNNEKIIINSPQNDKGQPGTVVTTEKIKNKVKYENEYLDVVYAVASPEVEVEVKNLKNGDKKIPVNKEVNPSNQVKELKLNIYKPLNSLEKTATIVYIPGKNWEVNKNQYTESTIFKRIKELTKKGLTVVIVEYRGLNEAPFPAQIYDVKGAIRFLRSNADKYGINHEKIGVIGENTGGTLSALLGVTNDKKNFEGNIGGNENVSSKISAVVTYGAISDIINLSKDANEKIINKDEAKDKFDSNQSLSAKLIDFDNEAWEGIGAIRKMKSNYSKLNDYYKSKVVLAEMASPLYFVGENSAPMFIVHKLNDKEVPIRQSLKMVDSLIKSNVENIYISDSEKINEEGYSDEKTIDYSLEWLAKKIK